MAILIFLKIKPKIVFILHIQNLKTIEKYFDYNEDVRKKFKK